MNRETFAIIGNPVGKSMSPQLFQTAYPQFSQGSYLLLETDDCQKAMELLKVLRIKAANVTMPLKAACLPMAEKLSEEVQQSNATNLPRREKNETCSACNTDAYGVRESFLAAGVPIQGKYALVVGAGGAGRAAALALTQAGARVSVANRSVREGLFPLDAIPRLLTTCSLVVYTLPVKKEDHLFLTLTKDHTVLDASYALAPLRQAAERAGACYLNGYHWLYHQAVEGFRLMTDLPPNTAAMRQWLGLEKR